MKIERELRQDRETTVNVEYCEDFIFFSTIWRVLSRSKRATGVEKGVERPQVSREENDKKGRIQ